MKDQNNQALIYLDALIIKLEQQVAKQAKAVVRASNMDNKGNVEYWFKKGAYQVRVEDLAHLKRMRRFIL